VDQGRERLRDLSVRLLRLHKVLLERERGAWEEARGPIAPGELLQLVIGGEQFAWLRSLSAMIARIDEVVDADDPIPEANVESFFAEARRLLRSGGAGAFETKYHEALRVSPEVVMAHAEVAKVLPPLAAPSSP